MTDHREFKDISTITLKNAVKSYCLKPAGFWGCSKGSANITEALRIRDITINRGDSIAVTGPNGSGKTTFLKLLSFMFPPSEGSVYLDGMDIWAEGTELQARRACPILLQNTALFSGTVLENAALGLLCRGLNRHDSALRALNALKLTGVSHLSERTKNQLSGGEARRAAIARILALEPGFMLLDEPTVSCDLESTEIIEDLILKLNHQMGVTIVMSSHDYRQSVKLASKSISFHKGRVFDSYLENYYHGELTKSGEYWIFRGHSGLNLVIPQYAFIIDEFSGFGPVCGAVTLGFDASSVILCDESSGNMDTQTNQGLVSMVRTRIDSGGDMEGLRRLVIDLPDGGSICADNFPAVADKTIGDKVFFTFASGSLYALR